MNTPGLSLTESTSLTALRAFLLSVLPPCTEVIQGQENRLPEPPDADFVVMTPILRERLETNVTTYFDRYPDAPSLKDVRQPTKLTIQIDVHGPAGADHMQVITTLWRDPYACDAFAAADLDIAPLYASEPRQAPFLNEAQQVETRWSVDLVMQVNPLVTVPQDLAQSLDIGTAGIP
ncbi:hypothetical protein R75461_07783 [Paraburkholderia nemoris]|uniref:phage neck terminator protein n=1 Tax=Paraburkholderia nemoris TaxID=2793076 RepID=UPI0019097BDF|nr:MULTISPECIES: hypothetical protein [Paraburkholderia]MBK3786518.1 hypothetical protein [Paraburkholderia aspalathi]CAE6857265.1 hypothetical protein R75461_07783 [Paraburkholderia nemoris]